MANWNNLKALGQVDITQDDIFDERTKQIVAWPKREEYIQEFQATWTLPQWTFFTSQQPTFEESQEVLKNFQAEQAIREQQSSPIEQEAITATVEQPVVERWVWPEIEAVPVDASGFGQEEFFNIVAKWQVGTPLSEEEKLFLAKTKAKLDAWQSLGNIFEGAADIGISPEQQALTDRQKESLGQQITDRERVQEERIADRLSILDDETRRARERIQRQTERLQTQTQRLRSVRGAGRSSATEQDIMNLERQWQDLINTLENKAALERDRIRMEEAGASADDIARIRQQITEIDSNIETQINENIAQQKQVDAEIGATFSESLEGILTTLGAAWVELWDYDDKATKALGYISDSKWNPLKLDENGDPIAPLSEEGFDVKLSNFKDANDNTYVYKNGKLDSIITNAWNILKWEQLTTAKVPAAVKAQKDDKQKRDYETALRKELNSRQEVKNYNTIRSSFLRMQKAKEASQRETWVGDIALVFSYMKMLDPQSVVREWEFATASNSGWASNSIINLYNKLLTWQILTDTQRNEFVALGKDILEWEKEVLTPIVWQYEDIADDAWLTRDFVIWDFDLDIPDSTDDTAWNWLWKFETSSWFNIDFDAFMNQAWQWTDTFEVDVDEFDNL